VRNRRASRRPRTAGHQIQRALLDVRGFRAPRVAGAGRPQVLRAGFASKQSAPRQHLKAHEEGQRARGRARHRRFPLRRDHAPHGRGAPFVPRRHAEVRSRVAGPSLHRGDHA